MRIQNLVLPILWILCLRRTTVADQKRMNAITPKYVCKEFDIVIKVPGRFGSKITSDSESIIEDFSSNIVIERTIIESR